MGIFKNNAKILPIKYKLLFTFILILIVSTSLFYYLTSGLGFNEGYVGAYVNLLVFDATLFAAITAYFLVDNWKNQHNASKISEYAEMGWKALNEENDQMIALKNLIQVGNFDKSFLMSSTYSSFDRLYLQMRSNSSVLKLCLELKDKMELSDDRSENVRIFILKLQNKFITSLTDFPKNEPKKEIETILEIQINKNIQLKEIFKEMIILKTL